MILPINKILKNHEQKSIKRNDTGELLILKEKDAPHSKQEGFMISMHQKYHTQKA